MGLADQHQRRLVDAVDQSVRRDLFRRAGEARDAREQVRDVHDVADDRVRLDHAGPAGERVDPHAAFGRVALAATEDHRRVARLRRVLGEVAVVAHDDDQRVVGDAELVHLVENIADPLVEELHLLDVVTAVRRRVLVVGGAGSGQRVQRPVLQEERLVLAGELAQLLHRLPLIAIVHFLVFPLGPALAGLHVDLADLLAAPALDAGDHRAGIRAERSIEGELAVVVVFQQPDADFLVG